jgi:hypothetical protein
MGTEDTHHRHMGVHAGQHGQLLVAGIALAAEGVRLLFPKRLTCQSCGHSVKL